jgi:hypothetical protein
MRPTLACWGCLLASTVGLLQAQVAVSGRVLDENGAAVPGARIEFTSASGVKQAAASASASGEFRVELKPGEYLVRTGHVGYFELDRYPVRVGDSPVHLAISLTHIKELVESIEVQASPPAIDPTQTTEQKELNNLEILEVPYPAPSDLRSSLPLFPGVVQDRTRQLHFNGGSADQATYLLDGFNISNPITGTLEARMSIDAVRAMELETSRFPAGKGRGSTASLDLKSGMGDDHLSFSGTNFFPGVTNQRGFYVNKWTPRVTFSGPIAPGRAWFYNGFDGFYGLDTIRELPPGRDRTRGLMGNNLTRFQVNVTPKQILTVSFLANYSDTDRAGLSFLDPAETTSDRRGNFFMSMLRHQIYFQNGLILELGFADSRGSARDVPMGSATYQITPFARRGNYFVDASRKISRQQWLSNLTLPARRLFGTHQLSFGADFERPAFEQNTVRHEYQVLRTDGSLARKVDFAGPGLVREHNFQSALYAQDRWAPREDLQFELGLRTDRDRIVSRTVLSPRASVAWAPGWLLDTKFSAGYGIFHDALTLGILGESEDQSSVATFYNRSGGVSLGPVITSFRADPHSLRIPASRVLSLAVDRKLPANFYGHLAWLRRAGLDGLTYENARVPVQMRSIAYFLTNQRHDRYDSLEFSARRTFRGQFEWFGGYTWSRARTDAIIGYSLENPIFARQAPGPLDWDTPHRFITWGWAPVPAPRLPRPFARLMTDVSISYLTEARTGFPFSVVNEEGFLVGKPNERRFPTYFSINLHLEKKFRFRGTMWAWRFGLNNLTDRDNPNVVNNTVDSPGFLTYQRGQPRSFSMRLRFLGRK